MKMYKLYMCILFVHVNLISAFTDDRVMDRLSYIEDRLNAESKFRREDSGTLFRELGSIKTMLQTSLGNTAEPSPTEIIPEQSNTVVEDKLKVLINGFKEEKALNERFRREIPEVQRQVQDLMTESKQIIASLEDILTGIESLKHQAELNHLETKRNLDLLEHGSEKIEENVLTLKTESELTKTSEAESLDYIRNNLKEIKEMSEHIQHTQKQSLEYITISNNLSTSLEEKLNSGKLYCTAKDNHSETYVTTSPRAPSVTYDSCLDLYNNGFQSSGVYKIKIKPEMEFSVYCDMKTDGGGWTVFQRRKDGSVDFYRTWEDYKNGFGELNSEFWLGNEYLNLMTDNDETHELRIEFGDHEGNNAYAKYSMFKVGPAGTKYFLEVSGYSGDAGDSLETSETDYGPHNKMKFSTKDSDNDNTLSTNCAKIFQGAWWYNKCLNSNLNSRFHSQSKCKNEWKCIIWETWKSSKYSLKFTEMKFR